MRIMVNGEAVELEARRLDAVLEELGHEAMAVATAVKARVQNSGQSCISPAPS